MNIQGSHLVLDENDLEEQAQVQQKSGHYQEAIKHYKRLLQISDTEQYRQQLANCYLQLAETNADLGVYQEAQVFWEQHCQYTEPPYQDYAKYIIWLMLSDNLDELKASLASLSAQQLDKQYPELAAVLGYLLLTNHPEFEQLLAQDAEFIAHLKIAQTAIQAAKDNDTESLTQALKQIPYRSAYRDFRLLLNGMLAMTDSPTHARERLTKIAVNSPYAQMAKILLACTKQGAELAHELAQLNYQQRSFVGDFKGLSNDQLDFIAHYSRQHEQLSNKVQFNLAIQYQSLIGTDTAQSVCQALLASYPAGNQDFIKHFGEANEFEDNRVKALRCEQENNLYDAEYYWKQCLAILENDAQDNALSCAMILQRLAATEPEGERRTALLIESVQYDSDDRNSYLQIINYFSQQVETAEDYQQWLSKTVAQFPQDIKVLTRAVKAATESKFYKQASEYAAKILEADPLNSFAKQTLFSSSLACARELMREKKHSLVAQELNNAEQLNLGKVYQQQVQLMHALCRFANDAEENGLQDIITALSALHAGPVNMYFRAMMEAFLIGLPVEQLVRELPGINQCVLSVQEMTEFIALLEQYSEYDDHRGFLFTALDAIKTPLIQSLSEHDYSGQLRLDLCQLLAKVGHFEMLRHSSNVAPFRSEKPIWQYYRIYADNNAQADDCTADQVRQLQSAGNLAKTEKDYPTSLLIDKFVDSYFEANPRQASRFIADLLGRFMHNDKQHDDGKVLEQLFGHLDEGVIIKLNNKAELIMKIETPEKLIQAMISQDEDTDAILLAVMQNPDILSALMLIKAAQELETDIQVDLDDVLAAFSIKTNHNPI